MTLKTIIQTLCLIFCAIYGSVTQGQDVSKKYKLLTYGLQDDTRRNASHIVQAKWGIEIYPLTSCIVSKEVEDSVRKENEKVEKLIQAKYGKTWEKKFDKEIEEEYKIEMQIDELVKKQSFIIDKGIVNPLPGAPFPMQPIDNSGNYNVSVSTYTEKWEEQKLYKLQVNYKKKVVIILNDFTQIPNK